MKMEAFGGRAWCLKAAALFSRVFENHAAAPAKATINLNLRLRAAPSPAGGRPAKRPVVIAPVDFSPLSLQAADQAIQLALDCGGLLLLLHAVYLNLTPYGPANPGWLKSALCREAMEKAEPVMNRARLAGVTTICAVEEGLPDRVIVRAAERWRAKLIVFAAPDSGRLARLFGRKTMAKVLRQTQCPVLVVNQGQTPSTTK